MQKRVGLQPDFDIFQQVAGTFGTGGDQANEG
jgi:hypothetical protein